VGGGFSLQPPLLPTTTATSNSISLLVKNLDKASVHRTESSVHDSSNDSWPSNELFSIAEFV